MTAPNTQTPYTDRIPQIQVRAREVNERALNLFAADRPLTAAEWDELIELEERTDDE